MDTIQDVISRLKLVLSVKESYGQGVTTALVTKDYEMIVKTMNIDITYAIRMLDHIKAKIMQDATNITGKEDDMKN